MAEKVIKIAYHGEESLIVIDYGTEQERKDIYEDLCAIWVNTSLNTTFRSCYFKGGSQICLKLSSAIQAILFEEESEE